MWTSPARQEAVVWVANHPAVVNGETRSAAEAITESAAKVLAVERVSVWLLSEDGRQLRCVDLFEQAAGKHSNGSLLSASDYPEYFSALRSGRAIAAMDARTDPCTHEFREGYLEPLGISSMLDGVIRLRGRVVGVVCHEHVGEVREWEPEDIDFAGDIAEQMAHTLQNHERAQAIEQFELVTRATGDAIWDVDLVKGVVWFNDRYQELAGQRPQDVESSWIWWTDRIRPGEREAVTESLKTATDDPQVSHWSADYHFRSGAGDERFIQDRAHITRNGDGRATRIVGCMRDETEFDRMLQEREEMDRRIQETQKFESLGVLAGGLAHDFNNLLGIMLGNVTMVREDLSGNEEGAVMLRDAEDAGRRAADLCKQMLAYSGKGKFVLRQLDLSWIVEDVENLLRASIGKKIELRVELSEELPRVLADGTEINQVIMNLVINASEAIGASPGHIEIRTGTMPIDGESLPALLGGAEMPPGEYVFLEVADNGQGMDAETLAKIFEPFYTTKFTGRGLGLAAVLGIVRGHRGAMTVESEPGAGAKFRMLLPANTSADDEVREQSGPEIESDGGPKAERALVLVVDDEAKMRDLLERVLRRLDCDIIMAVDGEDGLRIFRERQEDIRAVLLDLMMPKQGGIEVYEQLRELSPQIPVLLMSGYSEEAAMEKFSENGLTGFVQKPFQLSRLREMIRTAIKQR